MGGFMSSIGRKSKRFLSINNVVCCST